MPADPTGYVDVVTAGRGEVRVQGWASQWDLFVDGAWRDQGPVQITLFMNGRWVDGTFPADKPRSDVDAALVSQLLWQIRQPEHGLRLRHHGSRAEG